MKECQHCKKCYPDAVNVCPADGMPTAHTISGEPVLEGKYHLEKRLGQGGMGVVYCARHAYLKTQHAIKVILPDLVGNDPQLVTRFRQEALAAAAIRHQNVVSTTDYGVAAGTMPFLVMEYVEGESLHDLMAREVRVAPEKALELMTAICAGIGAAHKQGIVHRDLKPLNIMICTERQSLADGVKILDFGLAKIKSGELLGSFIQAQTTGLMGSPYYMAPEQWADDELDGRSDIYSLGVMLFQMLTGDVPFKGSSIPAIMKKHLYDNPPSFAELGLNLPLQLELAVRHSLEKDPKMRTPTVEMMVAELRSALGVNPTTQNLGSFSGSSLVVSSLSVLTNPPKSNVFINNVAVGESKPDGLLFLEGIQSGNHKLRVSHNGFLDWEDDVVLDGKPRQVVAQLRAAQTDANAIPRPNTAQIPAYQTLRPETSNNFSSAQSSQENYRQNSQQFQPQHSQQNWQTGNQSGGNISTASIAPKKPDFPKLLVGIIGISALLLLVTIGIGGAYWAGVFSPKPIAGNSASPSPTVDAPNVPKTESVKIAGGTFRMGRSDGRDNEQPEHDVTVKDFWIDKTEVTNAEYFDFTKKTGYKPLPSHWVNEKPLAGQENMPVRFVNIEDIKAFSEWRSKRDNLTYRLPTEEEWEYAARNGAKNNLYPWGDKFDAKCAVIDGQSGDPEPVGTRTCPDSWGVQDLIGNVFEWTGSEAKLYPGSKGTLNNLKESYVMVRGGSSFQKSTGDMAITSTFRQPIEAKKRSAELGFRLVRSE